LRTKITPLILSIPENNYETTWQRLQANRNYYADLVTQLQHEQQLVDSLASDPQPQQPTHNNILQKILNFYYTLNHWPARAVVRSITGMPKLDPQFIGSIKFAAGIVVVPAFYVVQISLVAWLSGSVWITLGYAISLPVCVALFKPQ
jgi:hypothetical protein